MTEPISNQTNISLENVIAALEACSFIRNPDCSKCYLDGPGSGFACRDQLRRNTLALLKMQELPTNTSITSAIECLLHPQDADDSDMAKTIDTAVRAMRSLKEREPIRPGIGIIHNDDGSKSYFLHCPFDGTTLIDGDNYCRKCGREVKWK